MQKYVIALYIRLSIEDYKYDSLSIENQSLVLHEYAASMPEALNAEIMEFIDNGYSGTNFERPQVQKLIELVRANQIDCIIVKDFSRFGRNSIETGYFIERVFPLFHTRFISISDDFDSAVHDIIKRLFAEHRRIIFSGNGYSEEWVKEAERRGLPNLKAGIDSVEAIRTEKAIKLFEEFGVYTRTELESRAEIEYEAYSKTVNIEAKTMIDMAGKQIIPAVVKYTTQLASSLTAVRTACEEADVSVQKELLLETSDKLSEMKVALAALKDILAKASAIKDNKEKAFAYLHEVCPAMVALRKPADELEMLVDKELWPFPSYGDLVFEV